MDAVDTRHFVGFLLFCRSYRWTGYSPRYGHVGTNEAASSDTTTWANMNSEQSQDDEHWNPILLLNFWKSTQPLAQMRAKLTPVEMLMTAKGSWTFMFHGVAFLDDISSPARVVGTNCSPPIGSCRWPKRKLGKDVLTLRGAMLSLEPATISQRRYPPNCSSRAKLRSDFPSRTVSIPINFFMDSPRSTTTSLSEK